MLVEDVMDRDPPLCFSGQDIVTAVRAIHERDAPGAPVFDQRFRLVGMLSLDDLVRWEARRSDSRGWLRTLDEPSLVAHVMTHEIIGVSEFETLSDVARIMRYVTRSVLPVLNDGGSLSGMISAGDIAAAIARTDASIRDEVHSLALNGDNTVQPGSIHVDVEAGMVTLTGLAQSRGSLMRLQREVASVTGVSRIDTRNVTWVRAIRSAT